jgi:beta-N-acetylhexosaminidase
MIGLASRAPEGERIIRNIAAGVDVYLFPDPIKDFERLIQGVREGRLSEERIYQAARRVLELKARLKLYQDPFGPEPSETQKHTFQQAAQDMADKSITVVRSDGRPPLRLETGAKVLTVTIGQLNQFIGQADLETFDLELRRREYQVDHLLNPESDELRQKVAGYDLVFMNIFTPPAMVLGTIRTVVGGFRSWGWRSIFVDHPQVVFTSFGNPYLLYEMPHIPNLALAYGASEVSQRAAVKVWLGEIEPQGECPVKMPRVTVKPLPTS